MIMWKFVQKRHLTSIPQFVLIAIILLLSSTIKIGNVLDALKIWCILRDNVKKSDKLQMFQLLNNWKLFNQNKLI